MAWVAKAPTPAPAHGTTLPTARNLEATATPKSRPSVAQMEKVAIVGECTRRAIPGRIADG